MEEETECPDSPDKVHCYHWYDGDECCYCGAPAERQEES